MNSNLQNKLSGFEATPPPGVWDRIAGTLDEGYIFSEKLYQYEEAPKSSVWQKIETSLEEEPASVIPITRRYKKPAQYVAAAAAVIAAIVIGVAMLTKKEALLTTTSQISAPFKDQQRNHSPVSSKREQAPPTTKTASSLPFQVNNESSPKRGESRLNSVKKLFAAVQHPTEESTIILGDGFVPQQAQPASFFDFSSEDNYMVYSDDNGHAMRVPKKLFSLVNCPAGDGSCTERIRQIQQKLLFNSSSTDFTGILEMLRQLQ